MGRPPSIPLEKKALIVLSVLAGEDASMVCQAVILAAPVWLAAWVSSVR